MGPGLIDDRSVYSYNGIELAGFSLVDLALPFQTSFFDALIRHTVLVFGFWEYSNEPQNKSIVVPGR